MALSLLGLGAILLLVATPFILEAIGFYGPSAEELYRGAPDWAAAATLESALAAQAIDGIDVVVLPITGQTGQVAVLTIPQDASAGGLQSQAEAETFIKETMAALVAANEANDLEVDQVAVNSAGSDGVDYSNLVALLQAEGLWEGQ